MKIHKLKNYTRGWVIGDFEPAILRTKDFEFCVKHYKAGDEEASHMHKVITEITIIVSGEFKMNEKTLKKDDVLIMEPGDIGKFSCVKDGSMAGVKFPSVRGDKYLI